MSALAALLLLGAVIALAIGLYFRHKAGRILKAPFVKTGDAAARGPAVAAKNGALSTEGTVSAPMTLRSPVTGTPCLYYELKVVGRWKEGDTTKSKDYLDTKAGSTFTLDDGSGPVPVFASKGGDFDLQQTFRESKREGFLADLRNSVGQREPILFGQFAFENPPNSVANEFECTERLLPVHPRLYACGKASDGGIGAPSWASLILSPRSRDALLGATARGARISLWTSAGAGLVGAVLALVATLTAEPAVAAEGPAPAVEAAVLAATPAAAVAPEPPEPMPEPITLRSRFSPSPRVVTGTAGGGRDARELAAECAGWISTTPDHVAMLPRRLRRLSLVVRSAADTTLVVRRPDGTYLCNDDLDAGELNPGVKGTFAPGRYEIWVGSYDAGARPEYRLGFSEQEHLVPAAL